MIVKFKSSSSLEYRRSAQISTSIFVDMADSIQARRRSYKRKRSVPCHEEVIKICCTGTSMSDLGFDHSCHLIIRHANSTINIVNGTSSTPHKCDIALGGSFIHQDTTTPYPNPTSSHISYPPALLSALCALSEYMVKFQLFLLWAIQNNTQIGSWDEASCYKAALQTNDLDPAAET